MTKIYSHLSDDTISAGPAAMQKRNRTMSECAGMHYANINFAGSNNNPIVGTSDMGKTYYTGIYVYYMGGVKGSVCIILKFTLPPFLPSGVAYDRKRYFSFG